MFWYTPEDEEVKQEITHFLGGNLTSYQNGKTLPGKFIDDVQYPESSAVVSSGYHEIITPDVALILRSEPNTGAIIQP